MISPKYSPGWSGGWVRFQTENSVIIYFIINTNNKDVGYGLHWLVAFFQTPSSAKFFHNQGAKLETNIHHAPLPHQHCPTPSYHFTGRPGRRCSLRFVVCPYRADWAARDWRPAGVLSNQRSAPRPMGESSLLLAEASVGKNAERVSHELGAREPSISTAPACVACRSGDSPRTFPAVRWQPSVNKRRNANWSVGPDSQASSISSAVAQSDFFFQRFCFCSSCKKRDLFLYTLPGSNDNASWHYGKADGIPYCRCPCKRNTHTGQAEKRQRAQKGKDFNYHMQTV